MDAGSFPRAGRPEGGGGPPGEVGQLVGVTQGEGGRACGHRAKESGRAEARRAGVEAGQRGPWTGRAWRCGLEPMVGWGQLCHER